MGKKKFSSLLAPAPNCFASSQRMVSYLTLEGREPFSMTNRGLSIKLRITPWFADTYLAYLDCAEKTGSDEGEVRVGIFLRRLSEDDQYERISNTRKGLWFDTDRIRHQRDRPTQDRQLFVRQTLDFDSEQNCLKDRVYGYEISDGCLPPSARVSAVNLSSDGRVATLHSGNWGCAMVIEVLIQEEGLRKITLGFDFEFHPICFLEDSFTDKQDLYTGSEDWYDWSIVLADDVEWNEITEGSRVYRKQPHKGIWALKGHRVHELDVKLSQCSHDIGSIVTLKQDESSSRLIWKFHIDDCVGPFRKYHLSSRRDLRGLCELDDTVEGLEGDDLLEEMNIYASC